MSIYKYLSKKEMQPQLQLPSPNGVLRGVVPPMAILSMNKEVEKVMSASATEGGVTGKRGPYAKLTASQKALIGKRAMEQVVTSAIHHFKTQNSELDLKKKTVRRFKKEYLAKLKKRKCEEVSEPDVMELPSKKERDLPC